MAAELGSRERNAKYKRYLLWRTGARSRKIPQLILETFLFRYGV
jgi:hypothetical protein